MAVNNSETIERLLRLPNIVGFEYDSHDWNVGDISEKLFSRDSSIILPRIENLKDFLGMPYIHDIFEGDDLSRRKWMSELVNYKCCPKDTYDLLRDMTIFGMNRLGVVYSSQLILLGSYLGENLELLKHFNRRFQGLMPTERGNTSITREDYNSMGFKEKKEHLFNMKEEVYGFMKGMADVAR